MIQLCIVCVSGRGKRWIKMGGLVERGSGGSIMCRTCPDEIDGVRGLAERGGAQVVKIQMCGIRKTVSGVCKLCLK